MLAPRLFTALPSHVHPPVARKAGPVAEPGVVAPNNLEIATGRPCGSPGQLRPVSWTDR